MTEIARKEGIFTEVMSEKSDGSSAKGLEWLRELEESCVE